MTGIHICIRLDLPNGNRIVPDEIALLEAIRTQGSITAAARYLGIGYRTAWLLVQEINSALQQPAVSTKLGGVKRSGALVIPVGEKVIELYRSIEGMTSASAHQEFQSIAALVRRQRTTYSIPTRERMLARHRKPFEVARQLNSRLKRKSARMLNITKGPEPGI
jgi:molybdate transport system regulatory protein